MTGRALRAARRGIQVTSACLAFFVAKSASATDAQDFPDTGTEPLGRGGAWVARATNPLATFQNPAGLAGQRTGVLGNVHLVFNKVCFERKGDGSKLDVPNGLDYPKVCNSNKGTPTPLPALAGVFRASDSLGIGLSVAPPNLYGPLKFPETVEVTNSFGAKQNVPSPGRYMLLEQSGLALNTTLGAGMEVMPGLRIGAGFVWGFANYKLANANMSLTPVRQPDGSWRDPVTSDVRAELSVADWFIPGATFGALYSPTRALDVGLNVLVQDAFDAHGDLTTKANYWTNNGTSDSPVVSDSADVEKGLGHFRIANPMEARIGARFHMPRGSAKTPSLVRDPLVDDLFDVELDVSYTRNSAYDRAMLRFPAKPVVPVKGTPGQVPQNNDVTFKVKRDSVGLRLGGDYVVLPGQLAVRAGGFWEPDVHNDDYANVALLASQRIGLAAGATYRVAFVDVEVGYMHVFVTDVDNGGNGKLLVVSGDAAGTPPFRSPYPINGGHFSQSANVLSVGATARF
ncbi:MAG: outer membrane protein transport protein [Myxococcales bacterium]|nr:outer membrane protein transport protein [Myxococcales bacterium]